MAIKKASRLSLPRGCTARFIGEGAANVVFELIFTKTASSEAREFQGYLLRVPKARKSTYRYPELQLYWEREIVPIFGREWLVEQTLVDLSASDIISQLNQLLAIEDARKPRSSRRADFIGSRVDNVRYGMLVEDMRKKNPGDYVIEFKPKWLTQSPSAPIKSTRCRTCAREALMQHKNYKGAMRRKFCPLDLVRCSVDSKSREALCATLVPDLGRESPQFHMFSEWLRTNDLLKTLATVQTQSDENGTLSKEDNSSHDSRFELAMALRDCSCFVRIPGPTTDYFQMKGSDIVRGKVEAKLGDVDRKNWAHKVVYWKAIEEKLGQGYYQGTEKPRQLTNCQLERE